LPIAALVMKFLSSVKLEGSLSLSQNPARRS